MRIRLLFVCALALAACRKSDPVLARVGKLEITQSEFQRKLADVSEGYQKYVTTASGRRQFLDVLIREKIIIAAAQHSSVPSSPQFRSRLDALRREEEERVRDGGEQLLTSMWIDDLRAKGVLAVTPEEAKQYLTEHPFEVVIRHVLLATPQQAEAVAKRIRGGANFAKVAEEESLDSTTAADGGKFPPLIYGEIIPELEEVVFRMRVGEIGGPLKSKFGYHILRKESEHRLDDDPENIDRVTHLIEKQKLDEYLQHMEEKFPVEVADEQFK